MDESLVVMKKDSTIPGKEVPGDGRDCSDQAWRFQANSGTKESSAKTSVALTVLLKACWPSPTAPKATSPAKIAPSANTGPEM